MKIKQTIGKKFLVILITAILLISTCVSAFGTENDQRTIAINFCIEGESTEGTIFQVYKVADFGDDGAIIPEESFKDYPIIWDIQTGQQMKEICDTLTGYIDSDKIPPDGEGFADNSGKTEIKVEGKGIYLVRGGLYKTEDAVYTILPSLILLNEEDTYREIQLKYEKEETPKEDITVVKVWTSDKDRIFRPDRIEAELYKDGELYDTVVLSEENGWKYTWEAMSTDCRWTVVEKTIISEYYVRVSKEEKVFFIYNDFYGTPLDDDFPPPPPDIPYTGTLWWPVPVLAAGGILLLITGIIAKRAR